MARETHLGASFRHVTARPHSWASGSAHWRGRGALGRSGPQATLLAAASWPPGYSGGGHYTARFFPRIPSIYELTTPLLVKQLVTEP